MVRVTPIKALSALTLYIGIHSLMQDAPSSMVGWYLMCSLLLMVLTGTALIVREAELEHLVEELQWVYFIWGLSAVCMILSTTYSTKLTDILDSLKF